MFELLALPPLAEILGLFQENENLGFDYKAPSGFLDRYQAQHLEVSTIQPLCKDYRRYPTVVGNQEACVTGQSRGGRTTSGQSETELKIQQIRSGSSFV